MQNLLLLHGALGSEATLFPLKEQLQPYFHTYTLGFSGHGGKAIPAAPFGMDMFAQDILNLLDEQQLESTYLFGYSMGGYAALCFARQHPDRVKGIFTLATKFDWSPETAAKETRLLNPAKIQEKVPQFAQTLASRHAPQNWKEVMQKTAEMMHHLGAQPPLSAETLAEVTVPVQVGVGDRDNMVSVEETTWAYRQLPQARLLVLPNTPHPLEKVATEKLSQEIRQFCS
ncbi:alpha/beta fold hydrolase [Pontibacter ruber]|uniref:Alpha/beta fold hydrolase n=1 Tax=Pontibacter ruber TaxID=1343895 RepID=A0ABW5CWG9_9BACT|nr:alpha/beta hydrolase [Pontibacter ruber]